MEAKQKMGYDQHAILFLKFSDKSVNMLELKSTMDPSVFKLYEGVKLVSVVNTKPETVILMGEGYERCLHDVHKYLMENHSSLGLPCPPSGIEYRDFFSEDGKVAEGHIKISYFNLRRVNTQNADT